MDSTSCNVEELYEIFEYTSHRKKYNMKRKYQNEYDLTKEIYILFHPVAYPYYKSNVSHSLLFKTLVY